MWKCLFDSNLLFSLLVCHRFKMCSVWPLPQKVFTSRVKIQVRFTEKYSAGTVGSVMLADTGFW